MRTIICVRLHAYDYMRKNYSRIMITTYITIFFRPYLPFLYRLYLHRFISTDLCRDLSSQILSLQIYLHRFYLHTSQILYLRRFIPPQIYTSLNLYFLRFIPPCISTVSHPHIITIVDCRLSLDKRISNLFYEKYEKLIYHVTQNYKILERCHKHVFGIFDAYVFFSVYFFIHNCTFYAHLHILHG
jgi:hypothetical protein